MLTNSIDELRTERAKFAQSIEYLKETAIEDEIFDRTEMVEEMYERETMKELRESADMLKKLDPEEELEEESAELDRLLNADDDLTFDDMINIEEKVKELL